MPAQVKTAIMVIILSCLIWVFAEREVTRSTTLDIDIVKSVELYEDLLVQFIDEDNRPLPLSSIRVTLTLEGPAGRIQRINDGRIDKKEILNVRNILKDEPEESQPQKYTVDIINDLFNNGFQYEDNVFLKVTNAEPASFDLQIRKLIKTTLPVKVFKLDGATELPTDFVEPSTIDAYVIQGQEPEFAQVLLNSEKQLQASKGEITAACTISLSRLDQSLTDRIQKFDIKVKLKQGADFLPEEIIKSPRLGILLPGVLQDKYRVEIEDKSPLTELPLKFRGSAAATASYRDSQFHLLLEINETDAPGQLINRQLKYYLPIDRSGELEILDKRTILIQFKLVPIELEEL